MLSELREKPFSTIIPVHPGGALCEEGQNIILGRIPGSGEGKDSRSLSEKELDSDFNFYKYLLILKT
jgi:hypothetical protein